MTFGSSSETSVAIAPGVLLSLKALSLIVLVFSVGASDFSDCSGSRGDLEATGEESFNYRYRRFDNIRLHRMSYHRNHSYLLNTFTI